MTNEFCNDELSEGELLIDGEIASSVELEKEKQIVQEKQTANVFDVHDNGAQTQIFIQNLNTLNAGKVQGNEIIDSKIINDQKYNLYNLENCNCFVETYKDSEYLAVAIILSVFEIVSLRDMDVLIESLIKFLPTTESRDNNRKEKRDIYISLNTMMAIIGGKKYVINGSQQYVGLGKNSEKVLFNILEQFPTLHGAIFEWLIDISRSYKYSTSYDVYQVAKAFARIISFDVVEAEKKIFPQLYIDSNNVGLLSMVVHVLYQNMKLENKVQYIISYWLKSGELWLWKAACLAYAQFEENNEKFPCKKAIEKKLVEKVFFMKKSDLNFISALLFRSKSFRELFAGVIDIAYREMDIEEKRQELAQIYLKVLRRGYYRICSSSVELPLVAYDTKNQQIRLYSIVEKIMYTYRLRKQLYTILTAYLNEIVNYDISNKVINHIAAFFYSMSSIDKDFHQDVRDFLKNIENDMAIRILNKVDFVLQEGAMKKNESVCK